MPDSFDTPTDAIFHLAHELKELEQRAIVVYEPIVNAIVLEVPGPDQKETLFTPMGRKVNDEG